MTVPFLIRETFFVADGTSGELAATGLVLAALVVLMLMQPLIVLLGVTLVAALAMQGGVSSALDAQGDSSRG